MTSAPTRRLLGAGAGLLAGAAGLAVASTVAAFQAGVTPPFLAVANRAVDLSPQPVKEWAIATFGTADKTVLIAGALVVVALLAMGAGAVGVRRPRAAAGAFVLLSAVASYAAVTDRVATASTTARLVPCVVLVVVAVGSLLALLRPLRVSPEEAHGAPTDGSAERRRRVLPGRVAGDELPAAFDRRAFLRAAGAVGAVAAAGGLFSRQLGGVSAAASRARVRIPVPDDPAPPVPPGATLDVPGITPYLTPNPRFYRVDTALVVPKVPVEDWRLRVHGMVDRELELSFEDLLSRRLLERRITLTCVSNPVGGDLVGNAAWIGVPVRDLLAEAGVHADADAVKSTSDDDMTIGTPLEALIDERDSLLAVAMNGEPLPLEHGFPVRMVVPGLYGYVSATKWLVDLEVTRFDRFDAYWSTRGYAERAPIKTSSRIDVPRPYARVEPGRTAVAGVAWSQDLGISRVEVRVDGGPWHTARLAAPDDIDTWRQWVWHWDATPGEHILEVRATDSAGHVQVARPSPVYPDGATGLDSVGVVVE